MTIPDDWPRPLALLVALLWGPAAPGWDIADNVHGMSPADWDRFADLATVRHRVAPPVAQALQGLEPSGPVPAAMPIAVRTRIDVAVRENVAATMAQIAESRRIRATLAAIGVDLTIFKGWPLAERLYGAADGRHAGDLDLLVPEDKITDSRIALEGIGYEVSAGTAKFRRRLRGLDNPQLIRACKDIELIHPATGLTVELHWRMLNYHGWPEFQDRPGALIPQRTEIGTILVPDDQANLMYLSTHGALHLWDHLKWLLDIAILARARGPETLAGDVDLARRTGVERPVLFALSLAHRLLGSPLPAGPAAVSQPDPVSAGLERWIIRRLARPKGSFDKQRYQAGIRWMGLRLSRDWRQRFGIIGYDTIRRLRLASLDLPGTRTAKNS